MPCCCFLLPSHMVKCILGTTALCGMPLDSRLQLAMHLSRCCCCCWQSLQLSSAASTLRPPLAFLTASGLRQAAWPVPLTWSTFGALWFAHRTKGPSLPCMTHPSIRRVTMLLVIRLVGHCYCSCQRGHARGVQNYSHRADHHRPSLLFMIGGMR